MASQFLRARQTRFAAFSAIYILVVLAVVVIANILADRYQKSYDATANKQYSLSEETHKIVDELTGPATITYFNQSTAFGEGRDLLSEYAGLSHKIRVRYVDPDKQPEITREAGITSIPAVTVAADGRTDRASNVTEQGITGALIRDIKGNTRTVCFLTGSGEHEISDSSRDGMSDFQQVLDHDSYKTLSINLVTSDQIPDACTAIVSAGPVGNYEQPEVTAIENYVEHGGRALFMLDPPLKMGPATIAENSRLTSLLAGWGVTPDKDLVLDLNPIDRVMGLSAQVPLVTNYSSQPIVADMRDTATAFPMSRSLTLTSSPDTSVQKLFQSSDDSFATMNLSSPRVSVNDPNNKRGPLVLAAAGTYTGGKPNDQGRFVVVGSSIWATNSGITFNGNSDLAGNAVNWLCSDEDLISIRPKTPEEQHITMTDAEMTLVRVISQFVLPFIVILGGGIVWWRRR